MNIIYVAYTSMTCVSPFENGRNRKICLVPYEYRLCCQVGTPLWFHKNLSNHYKPLLVRIELLD